MIEVQIAGRLTREGVDQVRWVLMEGDAEAVAGSPPVAEQPVRPAPAARADAEGRSVRAQVVRMLMGWLAMALGLGMALAAGVMVFGAPGALPRGGAGPVSTAAVGVAK